MNDKSFANGNGASNSQGPASPSSPVPKWMRDPEWLMLQEAKTSIWNLP